MHRGGVSAEVAGRCFLECIVDVVAVALLYVAVHIGTHGGRLFDNSFRSKHCFRLNLSRMYVVAA